MSFITIIVRTLGISGGKSGAAGSWSGSIVALRPDSGTVKLRQTIEAAGVAPVKLPARSPDLNSFAERWAKSVKEECLSKLILFGEKSLRHALRRALSRPSAAEATPTITLWLNPSSASTRPR